MMTKNCSGDELTQAATHLRPTQFGTKWFHLGVACCALEVRKHAYLKWNTLAPMTDIFKERMGGVKVNLAYTSERPTTTPK